MNDISINKRAARLALINRVAAAKEDLPGSGLSSLFIKQYPEYEEKEKRSRLNNVLQYRVTDEDITTRLENLVTLLERHN